MTDALQLDQFLAMPANEVEILLVTQGWLEVQFPSGPVTRVVLTADTEGLHGRVWYGLEQVTSVTTLDIESLIQFVQRSQF